MKKLFILFAIIAIVSKVAAQQEHHYTQFMYNKLLINPAYSGARGVPFVTGIYRNQWHGFEGAPKSALVSFNSPFMLDRVGVGVTLSHLQLGIQKSVYGSLAYSYDLIAKEDVSLRLGLMGSIKTIGMDFTKAKPIISNGDQSLGNARVNDFYANVGAGLYATIRENYYLGFSVPHIYANNISLENPTADKVAKEDPHIYAMAGASFKLSDDISLLPAILLKYVSNAPFDADLNVNLDIKKKVTVGLSYRLGGDGFGESADLMVFVQANSMIGIGMAYDFTLSKLKDYDAAGSLEALVQIDLKQKKNNLDNPRFFF